MLFGLQYVRFVLVVTYSKLQFTIEGVGGSDSLTQSFCSHHIFDLQHSAFLLAFLLLLLNNTVEGCYCEDHVEDISDLALGLEDFGGEEDGGTHHYLYLKFAG